jgi:hypothetical protein
MRSYFKLTNQRLAYQILRYQNQATEASEMSEWLLFNANWAIFQLYHGENKLIFNEMMTRSALY